MNRQLIFAIICLIGLTSPNNLIAQKVTCRSATNQSWSGGIAGRHGERFTFEIEVYSNRKMPVPDSCWVDGHVFALKMHDSITNDYGNMVLKKKHYSNVYTFTLNTSYNDERVDHEAVKMPKQGVACISYHVNGMVKYLPIKKYTATLEPISYP